jgi:hypothetical protein
MSDLSADKLGTQATPDTSAVWPAVDVFGNPYDKLNVNVVYVKGTQHFVAVPIGSTWAPADNARLNAKTVKVAGDATSKD